MRQMQLGLAMIVLLLLSSVAWADQYTSDPYTFEMVMSKDEVLCPAVMAQLNRDLDQFKEIRYASHKALPAVKWKRMNELNSNFNEDKPFSKWQWAKFDINNDHRIDLVVRQSSNDEAGPNDVYFIFDGSYQGLKHVRSFQQFMDAYRKVSTGFVHTTAGYILRELPPPNPAVEYEEIERLYAITPFVYKGVTYLHIDQAQPGTDNAVFHVVTKFTRPAVLPGKGDQSEEITFGRNQRELEDICYFKMYVDESHNFKRSDDRMTITP
jgi:hypothetical protein